MARKSTRLSAGMAKTAGRKRAGSSTTGQTTAGKRTKKQTGKATSTEGKYFEDGGRDSDDAAPVSSSLDEDAASEFDEDNEEGTSDDEQSDEHESDEAPKSRKKTTPRKDATSTTAIRAKGNDLWRTGVKTGLGPGTQVVIKKPKARAAGKTPYSDSTIHPNTILFLQELKENNDREWLKLHDPDYRQACEDWGSFIKALTQKLTALDDTVPELPIKDIVFRIYRDVRFSKDQTPYKPYFSAAWSRTGRKGPYAHYYVQISPGDSFVGGGLWHPEAGPTAAMRRNINAHPEHIKKVLTEDGVRREFLEGVAMNDTKAVKAFVASNNENALKTKPKGYDADHADIELLRLRNYTLGHKLAKDEVLGAGGLARVADLLSCMVPFITYLNGVVMPDEDPDDSSGENASSDGGGDGEGSE